MTDPLAVPAAELRPRHVAIVMDGNGRWAKERGLPRLEGHRRGADRVREITTFARELGIGCLTLYAFSRQNWRRPQQEVSGLMMFLAEFCISEREQLLENDIRATVIGDLTHVPPHTRAAVDRLIADTAHNRAMTVCMALDYGGREEILAAARRVVADVQAGTLAPQDIDEAAVARRLFTAQLTHPNPELFVRTSGEQRISNFLLWQIAHTTLHFTKTLWPDFSKAHFAAVLREYAATCAEATAAPALL